MKSCMLWVAATTVVVAALVVAVQADMIQVDTSTNMFVDSAGRQRFFHGVNVVYKGAPWHPSVGAFDAQYSFGPVDWENLQRWGLNVVRLGVMWPGVEPARGQYNQTYLNLMRSIVDELGARGIYTLVDFHQDLLADEFCGEGIPSWAVVTGDAPGFPVPVEKTPYPVDNSTGFPSASDCNKHGWPTYQFTQAACAAYQSIYSNKNGTQDAFAGYWTKVAETFNSSSHVIGYELMNEPWAGDVFQDPLLLVPSVADKVNLQPMYDRLNTAIRAVDPNHIIMFESVTWDDFVSVGFDHPPGGAAFADRSALSYHYYSNVNFNADLQFASRWKDIQRLGCGGMLTEFDISNTASNIETGLPQTLGLVDAFKQSWAGWEYKTFVEITGYGWGPYNPNGTVNHALVQRLSRPYPVAVAGTVSSFSYNVTTHVFELAYTSGTTTLPTEVFLSLEYHYPTGYNVTIAPEGVATTKFQPFQQGESGLLIISTAAEAGTSISVTVMPSASGVQTQQ